MNNEHRISNYGYSKFALYEGEKLGKELSSWEEKASKGSAGGRIATRQRWVLFYWEHG